VGSGLILLVIVGAWLAVLVPMALRSHDAAGSLGTVDKFHDAMRVLSRRGSGSAADPDEDPVPALPSPAARRAAAARRRRVLIALAAGCLATLVAALLGPAVLWVPHAVLDLLLVVFLLSLRRQTVLRAEREWRAAMAATPVRHGEARASRVLLSPAHVVGVPNRMPPRPQQLAPSAAAASAPAVRYDEMATQAERAARGAQGEQWSPVPVPAPTYLSAPVAPRQVVDLTRPGEWSDGVAAAERELGIVDSGRALDEILEPKRAVND
jgi:hypothetical protein